MAPVVATFAGQRAGFVTRLGAAVIDTAILLLGIQGSAWFITTWERALRRFAPPVDLAQLLLLGAPLVTVVYEVAFWRWRGQTPGKWLFGIRVIPIGGGTVGVGRGLLRLLGYLLSALPFYLGFLWILGPERRGFHDRLARTEVVYTRERLRGRPPARPPQRLSTA